MSAERVIYFRCAAASDNAHYVNQTGINLQLGKGSLPLCRQRMNGVPHVALSAGFVGTVPSDAAPCYLHQRWLRLSADVLFDLFEARCLG